MAPSTRGRHRSRLTPAVDPISSAGFSSSSSASGNGYAQAGLGHLCLGAASSELAFGWRAADPVAAARPSKRALDIALGGLLTACVLPLCLVIAAAITLIDGGPVIFWQRRVGRGGREFWFPKFRSMHAGAESRQEALRPQSDHGDSITFKMRADPRVTGTGWLLRTLSLDELPQLWCVLNGEMSLVGPRPPLPSEVRRYTPTQRGRLTVKPGITGLWQVSGRSTIPFEGQVALDIDYIARQSLRFDLEILARTIPAVVSCKGAW